MATDLHPPAQGPADLSALVREPQQERSRRTLGRIVEAALELLAAEGPDGLTVTRIADRARTSVGSFYARFDGKEELVRYVGETTLARALDEWSEALEAASRSKSTADLGELAAFLLAAFGEGAPARLLALDGVEDPAPTRLARFEARVRSDLEALLARMGAGELQGAVGASMTLASLEVMARRDADAVPSADKVAREVARAVSLYLSLPVEVAEADEASEADEVVQVEAAKGAEGAEGAEVAEGEEEVEEVSETTEPEHTSADRTAEPAVTARAAQEPAAAASEPHGTADRDREPTSAPHERSREDVEALSHEAADEEPDDAPDEEPYEEVDPFDVWN